MAGAYLRKVYDSIQRTERQRCWHPVDIGVDSKAATDIAAASEKDTKRTGHMQRRLHYWRKCNGMSKAFRLLGDFNWANCLTKPLNGPMLQKEADIFQVDVPP
jgi:hypothetical protein